MCAGSFEASDNVAPRIGTHALIDEPAAFDYAQLSHPPVTFRHEKLKVEQRLPAAQAYIEQHALNETFDGDLDDVGIVVQGGVLQRAAARAAGTRSGRRLRRQPAAGAWCST